MNKFFQCDVCGREVNTITYRDGMKFCAKCYNDNFKDATNFDLLVEKDKRIAELEEEKKKIQEIFADEMKVQDDENKTLLNSNRELTTRIVNLSNENAQLQEWLKNAPKFELGQDVFIVIDNIEKAKIEKIISTISKAEDECSIWYSITDVYGYALRLPEEQIFATKAEAQKYLEGHGNAPTN